MEYCGLDLGRKSSRYCVVDDHKDIVRKGNVRQTQDHLHSVFCLAHRCASSWKQRHRRSGQHTCCASSVTMGAPARCPHRPKESLLRYRTPPGGTAVGHVEERNGV
jgi:hypothetical protein